MKSLLFSNNKIGDFSPQTCGIINIDFYNLSNLIKPYNTIGINETTFNQIELTKDDLFLLESLRLKIKESMKYNDDEIIQVSISIFLISKAFKKPIFKILKELNI